jgi:hypothetical protein
MQRTRRQDRLIVAARVAMRRHDEHRQTADTSAGSSKPTLARNAAMSPQPSDASRIMILIVAITVGALLVVIALWAAAAIGTRWALVAVVGVHLATTAVVFEVVAYVIFGRAVLPLPHRHRW